MRATFTHTVLAAVLLGTALGTAALTTTAQSRRDVTYTPTEEVTFQTTTTFTSALELTRPTTGASRMKVRFRDAAAVRVLPDGRLLSLTGHDVSSIQMVLDTAHVQASAALSMPEEKVREIRASYEARTGRVMEDIGGTMWLDGTPDAVDAAVRQLEELQQLSVASWKALPRASSPKAMPTSRPTPRPVVKAPDADIFDTTNLPERFPDYDAVTEWEKPIGEVPYIDHDANLELHERNIMGQLRRGQRYARDRNEQQMKQRGLRGEAVYCCVFTLSGQPGQELWEKRCEGSMGNMTADQCDDLNIDGLSVAFVRNAWTGPGDPTNDCFTNCLDNNLQANNYGACCTVGTREGEDLLQFDCVANGGDFQGLTPDPSAYLAYANCDACPQITGSCCFTTLTGFNTFIWDNTNPIWPKSVCNLGFAKTQEPAVEPFRLRSPAAAMYTGWTANLDDRWQPTAEPLWNWQNEEPTANRTMNPTVVVSARLVSNTLDERACNICVAEGGVWQGGGSKPHTIVWDDLDAISMACGATLGIIDCDTGELGPTSVVGACAVAGVPTNVTQLDCYDAGQGADLNQFSCWQNDMLTPANSLTPEPEGTDIHDSYWRPFWAQWFTPPSNGTFEVPDIYEFFVPYWEYNGTYTNWTGWDPARWWDEGFQPNIALVGFPATTRDNFLTVFPDFSIETGILPCFPATDDLTEVDPDFIRNFTPADYGPAIRFGLPPTCFEWVELLGLPQQPGDLFEWTDAETGALWPVIPHHVQYVFEVQVVGDANVEVDTFPWDEGWNRWTNDPKFFDMEHDAAQNDNLGYSPSYDFNAGQRYLSEDRPGITRWQYIGDGLRPHPGETPGIPGDDQYGYPVPVDAIQDVYGSCYYQHTDFFPTIPGTEDNTQFPGWQSCYAGTACDEVLCCDAVNEIIPGCCVGGVETSSWSSLCVQIALDIIMNDMAAGGDYSTFTCEGIRPFMAPEWPLEDPDMVMLNPWQYNPDARNARLNVYFESTLPSDLRPSAPVPPGDPNWESYRREVTMAARVSMFATRCQGIYSPKGQCNVPGSESGLSSWDIVADDEDVILGCQDYDCCLRVVREMLEEKDAETDSDQYNDFEWVPRQWTQDMADTAIATCYPGVAGTMDLLNDETPNYFPLQMNISREALRETLALSTSPKTSDTEMVRHIHGPDDNELDLWTSDSDPSFSIDLTQLIPAPFASTMRSAGTQTLKNMNIYDVLPGPFYGGDGLALYPEQDVATFDGDFDTLMKISQNHSALFPGTEIGGRGRATNIGVLGETAWLQTNGLHGAVHEDLGNILPDPEYDWSLKNADGTYVNGLNPIDLTNGSRVTAMLGVIGATSPTANWDGLLDLDDNGACCLVTSCSDLLAEEGCHLAGGTFYRGTTCADIDDCASRSSVPGTNTFGVRGMAPDARTWFFPTQTQFGNRLEEAILSAINVLQPGDVLLLAMDTPVDGTNWLENPELQNFILMAQDKNILVIAPAGDRAVAIEVTDTEIDLAATLIVGGAVPASNGQYLRWWSSNFAAGDEGGNTVAERNPASVSSCAWGGHVTTTGGNMNLTRTLQNTLTATDQKTRSRSYTNDFGSAFAGSHAAAAQIAGSVACAQGLVRQVYNFQLHPAAMAQRLYTSATNGPGIPNGFLGALGQYNTFGYPGWDIDFANGENPRSVGRFPRLDKLALDIVLLDPPDDEEIVTEPPAFQAGFSVLAGELISGQVAFIRAADDDLVIQVNSDTLSEGPIATTEWVPGPAYHLGYGNAIEVMVTFQTSGFFNFVEGFSVDLQRSGPNRQGQIIPYVFNFTLNEWEQLYPATNTQTADLNPAINNYTPNVNFDPRFYLNPDPEREDEIYIRFGVACNGSPYSILWDYVDINGLDTPDDGGGGDP